MSFPLRTIRRSCTRFQCVHQAVRLQRQSVRFFSDQPRNGKKSSTVFATLLAFGVCLTAFGVYQHFYDALTMWPPQLRQDLRQGLYAKRKGDLDTAISYLSKAWDTAKSTPLDTLGADPLLKMSGIAITLAGVLEDAGLNEQAYQIYEEGLLSMVYRPSEPVQGLTTDVRKARISTPEDKIRALSIAYKLGELANTLQKPLAEEERWLTLCVEGLVSFMPASGHRVLELRKTLEGLDLPSWVMLNDFAAPFEALGSFYARTGKPEYALILYMQAIAFLLPPMDAQLSSSVEDKCRGAQIMGNMAELIIRGYSRDNIPPEVLANAEGRLKEALELTQAARKQLPFSRHDLCEEIYAVSLYNFAMIRQFAGDMDTAREHFRQSLRQAKSIDMQKGIVKAEAALSNLDSPK